MKIETLKPIFYWSGLFVFLAFELRSFYRWGRLLGTLTWGIDQSRIIIGIGSHRNFDRLIFSHMWLLPFTKKSL